MPLFVLALALTQAGTARVHGRVTDGSHAVIASAHVVVVDGTGHTHDAATDRHGAFAVDGVAPGSITVVISAPGFDDFQQISPIVPGQDLAVEATLAIAVQRQTIIVEGTAVGTDPSSNGNALVLKGRDLDALSDDPNELEAQLKALAIAAGPNGPQIYIDGFTGGKLPPKHAIQEVRVNQDPYSAEYDTPGSARIEIITKPGGATFHGRLLADGGAASFDARNPLVSEPSSYRAGAFTASVDGPLGSKGTFFFVADEIAIRDSAAVDAIALDSSLGPERLRQLFAAPHQSTEINPRIDVQPSARDTVSLRYRFFGSKDRGKGVGQFALPSQALTVRTREHDVQASDRRVLGAKTFLDTRVEFRRFAFAQTAADASPQIVVAGAFTGGGNASGDQTSALDHIELRESLSASRGSHLLKLGGLLRINGASDANRQNFNGTYTFSSLEAYRTTLLGLSAGWTPAAIRAAGGGASQFSVSSGQPAIHDTQIDGAVFAQDDWRLSRAVTADLGIRFEAQDEIGGTANVAPRAAIAWAFGHRTGGGPQWVARSGAGLFFQRIPQTLFLQAKRLSAASLVTQYVIQEPDFYPAAPSPAALEAAAPAPTTYRLAPSIEVPATMQASATLERRLGRASDVTAGYVYSTGWHQLLSENVHAPGGTGVPLSPLYEYQSAGIFNEHQLTVNVTLKPWRRVGVQGAYVLGSARGDSNGPNSFPSNPFDLRGDYGRTSFDVRQRMTLFAGIDGPGFRLVPSITAASGQPFDITVGGDLNHDSIFNDRPAFASDLTRPTVVMTRFGAFDASPRPGQTIIPRNFGTGPAQFFVNLRAMKPFVVHQHDTLRVDVLAMNLLNRVNLVPPVGNLSSPLFGRSTALSSVGPSGANREIRFQLQFIF